jgi:hypothetical protein
MQQINQWKRMLALALTASVLLVTFSVSQPVGAADLVPVQGGILDVLERQKAAIVGAWDAPDSTGFQALLTFHADGTISSSDEDPTATNGHGIWRHLGGTQFAFTYIQHKKAGQQQQGTTTVWGRINIESSGRQFSGTLHFEFADTEGNVVDSDALQGLNLTLTGRRVQIRL